MYQIAEFLLAGVLLENIFIWSAFFCTVCVAMSFGYYGMANPERSVAWEVFAFCISGCAAVVCAFAIAAFVGMSDYADVLGIVALAVLFATLVGSIPRLVYQVWQRNHWTLSFLFRLCAYVAVLIVIGRTVERDAFVLLPATVVLGLGFFAVLPAAKLLTREWRLWLLFPLPAFLLAIPNVTVLGFHNEEWRLQTLLRKLGVAIWPLFNAEAFAQAVGTVLFVFLAAGVHVFALHFLAPALDREASIPGLESSTGEPQNDDRIFQ